MKTFYEKKITIRVPSLPNDVDAGAICDVIDDDDQLIAALDAAKARLEQIIPKAWNATVVLD